MRGYNKPRYNGMRETAGGRVGGGLVGETVDRSLLKCFLEALRNFLSIHHMCDNAGYANL